jgi:hypothetical protein
MAQITDKNIAVLSYFIVAINPFYGLISTF